MADEWRYQVTLIKAEADGIGPSLLLSAPGKGPQYLFNVPEGFSRLVLEHKLRPSARLASVFLTSLRPQCAGGLGGLLLRLAGDGHGQLQLVGPDYTSAFLHSLRHIIYWRHPKVFVCDCKPSRPLPVFDDDFVTVYPILLNDMLSVCPWCEHGKHIPKISEIDKRYAVGPRAKCKFGYEFFDDTSSSVSFEESDDSTSCSFEGPESWDSHQDKFKSFNISQCDQRVSTRCVVQNDRHPKGSELLYGGTEIAEGKRTDVDEEGSSYKHQKAAFDKSISEQCSNMNGKNKKEVSSANLLATSMEELYGVGEECSDTNGSTAQVNWAFDEKLLKNYGSVKRSGSAEEVSTRCKRKKGVGIRGLKKSAILDPEVGNKHGFKVLQGSTYPSESDMNFHTKSNIRLLQKPETSQRMEMTADSGALELFPGNCLHGPKNEATNAAKNCTMLGVGMHGTLQIKDGQTGESSAMEQDVRLGNIFITPWKVKGRQTAHVSISDGLETELLWRVHNNLEMELPELPDGAIPVYIKCPNGNLIVIDEETVKENHLSNDRTKEDQMPSKSREALGFLCYMKKLRSAMVLINCESLELIDGLYQHPLLSCISSSNTCGKGRSGYFHSVSAVIHLSPPTVLRSEKYVSWMKKLRNDILQITMQGGAAEFGFLSSFSTLAKLNKVNKEIFPLPFNASLPAQQIDNQNLEHFGLSRQVKTGRLLMSIVFQRKLGKEVQVILDDSLCQDITNVELIQKAFAERESYLCEKDNKTTEDILVSSPTASMQMCANHLKFSGIGGVHSTLNNAITKPAEFKLLFLGTGCAEPSKYRGSSGILLQMHDSRTGMLLDAGEGVMGQVLRAFGKHRMEMVIDSLQCVWISHKHADHVLGTVSIIAARSKTSPGLLVVGPTAVHDWILEVNQVYRRLGYPLPPFIFIHSKEFIDHQQGSSGYKRLANEDPVSRMLEHLQLHSIRCVWVDHCFQACGLVLSSVNGWSIVYSGDTRPCGRLVEAGMGCTLLIHEATFEDELESHAKAKRHSTISEAVKVGQQMGAQHIILTHFSQRSPKVMGIDVAKHQNASLAYDGMVVCSSHLHALPKLMQYLVCLFPYNDRNLIDWDYEANFLVNQAEQVPVASSIGPNKLLPKGNESMTNEMLSDDAKAIPSVNSLSSELHCLPKHIRWDESDSEERCCLPKQIRWDQSDSEERCCHLKHIRWDDSESD
eukprot:Gb_33261 [translate_table: standard]